MIARLFEDNDGNLSSMRVVWTISVLTIVFTWTYISISSGTLQNFTAGDAAWFAALFGGKVAQTYVERQDQVKNISYSREIPKDDRE